MWYGFTSGGWSRLRVPEGQAQIQMPFKSKAQRRKFAELLVRGKISDQTFEEWNRETGSAKLPERIKPKTSAKTREKLKPKPRRKRWAIKK